MITVGLIKELEYIQKYTKNPVFITFHLKSKLDVVINDGYMNVYYKDKHIWGESVNEDSMFGIESCDSISRILACIDSGNIGWQEYSYFEKT